MEWRDEAIVLSTRPLGEGGVVVELMTAEHGRHLGLVRGGRSRRLAAVLQPGNGVAAVWRARLEDQLGTFRVEPVASRAAALTESAVGAFGLTLAAAHLRLLAEREPHRFLYETLGVVLDHLDDPAVAGPLMVRFELALLDELGFGLDLAACAATGATRELAYVSPKSGRAVSREAGAPYRDRLLPLPRFLVDRTANAPPEPGEIRDGFRLAAFFLERHVLEPRGKALPPEREMLLAALDRAAARGG
jgi:DNA repair protein RecO (recombination protein O)